MGHVEGPPTGLDCSLVRLVPEVQRIPERERVAVRCAPARELERDVEPHLGRELVYDTEAPELRRVSRDEGDSDKAGVARRGP